MLLGRLLEETLDRLARCKRPELVMGDTFFNISHQAEQFKHYYPSEKTDFPITSSLVRLLSHGHRTKMQVDWAIDNCGETQVRPTLKNMYYIIY